MTEYTYPKARHDYRNPSWSIGAMTDDFGWGTEHWPISGDDIALYRAGVERAS